MRGAGLTCENCEDGRCPCHVGCEACVGTGVCPDCHGITVNEVVAATERNIEYLAKRGIFWCPTCRRRTRPLAAMPDFEEFRTTRYAYWAKMVSLERCTGCHVAFQDVRGRTFGYKIKERLRALCATP